MRSLTAVMAAALVLLPAAPASAAGQPPVVVDDAVTYRNNGGTDYVVDALANDSDPDGDALTYTAVTPAAKGDAYLQGGQLYYKPFLAETGTDSFTYSVSDGDGNTATGTVTATLWVDPAAPSGLTISGSGTDSATLTWSAAARAAQYRVWRNGVLVHTTSALTWTDTGLLPSSDNRYQVTAVNGGGWSGPLSTNVFRRPQQATPTGLVIDATGDPTGLSLIWNGSFGPWNVYRDGALITTTTSPEFTDTGLVTGRTYDYQLQLVFPSSATVVYPPSPLTDAVQGVPGQPTPIAARFRALGGAAGTLGWVTVSEHAIPGGRRQDHQGGVLLQPDGQSAYAVMQDFAAAHAAAGGPSGDLGFPLEDRECGLPSGGCGQLFEGGSIWYTQYTGTHVVSLAIEDNWAAGGWEEGRLGYPTTDEECGLRADGGGCRQNFEGGSIYSSTGNGAHAVFTPYYDAWGRHGWESGRLGYPTTEEICGRAGGGCYQEFEGGTIHWSPASGMRAVFTPYGDVWARHGGEAGRLGYPTTEEICGRAGGGCYQQFQGGTIHWSGPSGMRAVFAPYRDAWARHGGEAGRLGYPTTEEICGRAGGGCYQQFQGGTIHWSGPSGMRAVFAPYRDAWARQGGEAGRLGYPTTDEICGRAGGGCYQQFQGGTIHWSGPSGMRAVFAPYRDTWARHGAEAGRLGYPTTDEICGLTRGGCYQQFQGGTIHWSGPSGMRAVFTPYRDAWARHGAEAGRLGYPTTDEICGGGCYQQFQGGSINWSPASGMRVF